MCTFINSLPSQSKTAETTRKKNLALFIKPTNNNEYYKFRLLAFKSPQKNDRDYPFIERYIHQHWTKDSEGKSKIDAQVVCPVTKFANVDGNRYDACPICKFANMNFVTWKESGWKDRESAKKNKEFGRKFEAIIPVYVKQDPTYPQNNGQLRVLIFTDKEFYKKFKQKIQETSRNVCCFNGGKAVDFYLHMSVVPKTINEGQPNEYTYNEKVIDKFGFTKAESAYEIPSINKENIDKFEFDDTYYVSSTPDELQDFYNNYIKLSSNDDIPDEDVVVYEAPKPKTTNKPKLENKNVVENNNDDITDEDIESLANVDLSEDPDDLHDVDEISDSSSDVDNSDSDEISEAELNALVDDLDI